MHSAARAHQRARADTTHSFHIRLRGTTDKAGPRRPERLICRVYVPCDDTHGALATKECRVNQ
jgi:hypothetical protein